MRLSATNLVLRCYARCKENHWEAFCLDLSLASQGDSYREARHKLHAMIEDYVRDALVGEDKEFVHQLIPRRAPWLQWARFYSYVARQKFGLLKSGIRRLFYEPIPLAPIHVHV